MISPPASAPPHPDTGITLSIVTPVLNRRLMLPDAVNSVRAQRQHVLEHIVIDGGSTDGTLEWLRQQPDLALVTEGDHGVFDAMNKGIAMARGEVVGLLNSDDCYEPGALSAVASVFDDEPAADVVAGACLLCEDDAIIGRFPPPPVPLDARYVFFGPCNPNAMFVRRRLFARIGAFDLAYPLSADRDLLARLYQHQARIVALDDIVYRYRQHEGSLTLDAGLRRQPQLRRELLAIARKWRRATETDLPLRSAARIVEGRQLLRLAQASLSHGAVGAALSYAFCEDGTPSLQPLIASMAALSDVASGRSAILD